MTFSNFFQEFKYLFFRLFASTPIWKRQLHFSEIIDEKNWKIKIYPGLNMRMAEKLLMCKLMISRKVSWNTSKFIKGILNLWKFSSTDFHSLRLHITTVCNSVIRVFYFFFFLWNFKNGKKIGNPLFRLMYLEYI